MTADLDLIPPQRREAARAALELVLGARGVGPIALLKGGISGALIYRVERDGQSFVLRLEPERVALVHRRRGFICMETAAAIGIAPGVHFADPVTGAVIMDFVNAKPISTHPGGQMGIACELGALIARIQTTAQFPTLLGGQDDMTACLLQSLARSGMFAAGLLNRHRDELARIRAAIPWDLSSLVSSHNDPNPRNILFDGTRLWLVDWELASCNDYLFDLAIATTEIADTQELKAALLGAAFRQPADATLHARLRLVRQLARLFYGCIALDAVSDGQSEREGTLDALSPAQFQAAAAQGHLAPEEIGYAFGKMSLQAFIDGCSAPDFAQALALAKLAPPPGQPSLVEPTRKWPP